ncbi:BlaR1 family beta-lactam sensor/signal transducer [Oceanobacillus arenosus]|uniref:BlaR1 family beta-lactam sensor/signal transducer n=1 Tax=Oceanobacillus arenosus TaxID=1229153 RepID=A0A3D8PKQ1_9BACI|nr:BlaR1 family beta-lactam sensor/signal transducer [Oceanobacillus arenosus]RDW15819.1 BlaR1 family beta-lactam sensor/signal transducer [Oceanobacillus arenosus]
MSVSDFIINFILSSLTVGIIMLIKKVFHKQLSAKWQYNLWFLLLLVLLLPFLPNDSIHFDTHFHSVDMNDMSAITAAKDEKTAAVNNANWMEDFTLSVQRSSSAILNIAAASIWISGMIVLAVVMLHAGLKLKRIKGTMAKLKDEEALIIFNQCKQQLDISGKLIVGESALVNSPMTFGLLKTYIVLPERFDEWLSKEEIKYIFLHELTHYKSKDILINYAAAIFQILYWFNPLVWFAFKEMRLDREIACDAAVLHALDEDCYTDYGHTILNFIDGSSKQRNFTLANQLNGSKKQVEKRIKKIASFKRDLRLQKLKSAVIFMMAGVLLLVSQIPFVSAMGQANNRYDFDGGKVTYEDLSDYFNEYEGSFVLYDKQADKYHIYNEDQSTLRVSPNSTYKIYSALFGLESNIITDGNSTLRWNGEKYPYASWNMDQDLDTAMADSVTWYFQELDEKMPLRTIQSNLKKIGYGNYDVSGGIEQYWLESSLKISPVEQVQLLEAFYSNKFGFKEKHVQTVKDTLLLEDNDDLQLSGKTGTGTVNGRSINGWFIGYVEEKDNTYFFATNIQHKDHALGSRAAEITLSILKDKGIY